jgi:hypothetical protein
VICIKVDFVQGIFLSKKEFIYIAIEDIAGDPSNYKGLSVYPKSSKYISTLYEP